MSVSPDERHPLRALALSAQSAEKKGRGRPPALPPEFVSLVSEGHPKVRSRRGQQEACYRAYATGILANVPECTWLMSNDTLGRYSILAELGRITDPSLLIIVALRVCDAKPAARTAVPYIREIRLLRETPGRQNAPHSRNLAKQLLDCMKDYLRLHPEATESDGMDALRMASDALRTAQARRRRAGQDAGGAGGE